MPRVRVGRDPHYVTSSNVSSPTRKCSGTHPATRFTKGSNPAGDAELSGSSADGSSRGNDGRLPRARPRVG